MQTIRNTGKEEQKGSEGGKEEEKKKVLTWRRIKACKEEAVRKKG